MAELPRPLDAKQAAESLLRWSRSVRFPGDQFFHEDLKDAAMMLVRYSELSPQEKHDG